MVAENPMNGPNERFSAKVAYERSLLGIPELRDGKAGFQWSRGNGVMAPKSKETEK